ncbi:MAG: ABC transporter ATP-binding protein [Deltaproteobacteria bacterium]|nr:ABC transporter ATP-binding protein [Deltaproteobacteria bacterium]
MTADLAISCKGLVKRYEDDVLAVTGLDLGIARGECFGLLGPNGAGKTTTVEILEGLLEPTSGEVRVLGMSYAQDEASLRARIGITLQETHLDDRLTVAEIVAMFRSFYASGRTVDEVLELVSLAEKRGSWYERLSGGQKQRLAVALAVVGDPELVFLDEPTTGLDPQSRRQLWDVILSFKRQGKTILITTHYMEEAERLCDRVAIVDRGKVIAQGSPRDLISEHIGGEVVEFSATPSDLPRDEIGRLPGVKAVRASGPGFALTVDPVHVAVPALLGFLTARGASLDGLSTHSATLEDVFLALTGRKLRD